MKRLRNYMIGVDQGEAVVFSDFEDGGEMWVGQGPRERRKQIQFSGTFRTPPTVQTSVSLWDLDTQTAFRGDVKAENITTKTCDIVFRTWSDTRVARVRVAWLAIGELSDPEDWDLY